MSDFEREDMEVEAVVNNRPHIDPVEPVEVQAPKTQGKPVKNTSGKDKPVNAQWEPVKPAPNYLDKLRATAKDSCFYAVVSAVVFWWQQTGRLDYTTAWYALLVCVGMVFFSIGKNWYWGDK